MRSHLRNLSMAYLHPRLYSDAMGALKALL